ncbi:teichuronic acid biosynthesis protein TuaG [Metabacillus sp. HB246100]
MEKDKPLVSIITPTYNGERYILDTINSVFSQTFENWEMLIVDDYSTDRTRDILEEYSKRDKRIKPVYLKENQGAAVARNTALRHAQGKYIAFLDGDDKWYPEKLSKQLDFMEKHDIAFSYTEYDLMDEKGMSLGSIVTVPKTIDYHGLLKNTIIGCLTVMINKEKTGYFEMPNIRTRQDFALWLSILKKGFLAYGMQETLSTYRLVPGSISSNKIKAAKKTWYVYRKVERLSILYSTWCFINYAFQAIKKRL